MAIQVVRKIAVVEHKVQSVVLVPVVVAEVFQGGYLGGGVVCVLGYLREVAVGVPQHLPQVAGVRVVDTPCGVGGVVGVVAVHKPFCSVVVALLLAADAACGSEVLHRVQ